MAQPNTARGGAAKQTVGAAPRMNPAAKEPEPKRGPNVRVKPFGYFGAFAKVTRRKGGTVISNTRSNGNSHPTTHNMVGPKAAKNKKKGQPKSPKMPCVLIQSRKDYFLRLCASFQIKNPNPAKNRTMRPTVRTPANTTLSKNMTVASWPLLCCDGAKLTNRAGAEIDQDQVRSTQRIKAGK